MSVILPVATIGAPMVAASASPGCTGWNSTTRPPDYIRVLRRQTGRVDRVPFRQYVLTVLGKEWPGYLPQQVINAGAVAVKQYAWYHALGRGRVSRRGQCFDVTDGVGDQLYKPGRARIRQDHYTALNATWGVRLVKGGSLFMTGYRTGLKGACGHDATGWKLYARSAVRCAERGDGYLTILRIYYGPVSVVSAGGAASAADSSYSTSSTSGTSSTSDGVTIAPDNGVELVQFTLPPDIAARMPLDLIDAATPPAPAPTTTTAPAPVTDPQYPDYVTERAFSTV